MHGRLNGSKICTSWGLEWSNTQNILSPNLAWRSYAPISYASRAVSCGLCHDAADNQAGLRRARFCVLAPQWLTRTSSSGSLIVKRDSGFMGSACTIRVFLDAAPVADLAAGEMVELFVSLGEHNVVASSNGICGGGTPEAVVVIMPERQRILRIASGQSGHIFLQPSAF